MGEAEDHEEVVTSGEAYEASGVISKEDSKARVTGDRVMAMMDE